MSKPNDPLSNRATVLDVNSLCLPTDRLTLGQLRRLDPDLFTAKALGEVRLIDLKAIPAFSLELVLAEKAFASACGEVDPHPDDDRSASIEMLNSDYCELGLSTGEQMTRQLVRDFETAAAEQGRKRTPRP